MGYVMRFDRDSGSSAPQNEDTAECRVCGGNAARLARARVLDRYDVQYFRCDDCGLTQTERPYWLSEAYSSPIARSDVGLVARNLVFAASTKAIIEAFFDRRAQFLDYGAGYGLFVRLLRDQGYDFRWSDRYTENLFALGHEADSAAGQFELLTAFEVFEHLANPIESLEEMLTYSSSILFSTTLMPASLPGPRDWWYYALYSGQHVVLYSRKALEALAARAGRRLYSDGRSLHLLTDRVISASAFSLLCRFRVAKVANLFTRRPSLTQADYDAAIRASDTGSTSHR